MVPNHGRSLGQELFCWQHQNIKYLRNPFKKDLISFTKESLLYKNNFSSKDDLKSWVLEGDAEVIIKDNWLEMFSPDEKSHHVFWCPMELPSSFMAEWEMQNLNLNAGLCIVFFFSKRN